LHPSRGTSQHYDSGYDTNQDTRQLSRQQSSDSSYSASSAEHRSNDGRRPLSRQDSLTLLKKRNPNATRSRRRISNGAITCNGSVERDESNLERSPRRSQYANEEQGTPQYSQSSRPPAPPQEQENWSVEPAHHAAHRAHSSKPEWNCDAEAPSPQAEQPYREPAQPRAKKGSVKAKARMPPEWNTDAEPAADDDWNVQAPPQRKPARTKAHTTRPPPDRESPHHSGQGFGALYQDPHEHQSTRQHRDQPRRDDYESPHGGRQDNYDSPQRGGRDSYDSPHGGRQDNCDSPQRGGRDNYDSPHGGGQDAYASQQSPGAAKSNEPQGLQTEEVSGSMGKCRICERSFFVEKLAKHEAVCQGIKRKKYEKTKVAACAVATAKTVPKGGKTAAEKREDQAVCAAVPKWKRESDALKAAMQAARYYSNPKKGSKGGADMPPPAPAPPDPSLKQCPYCQRRFNPESCDRHMKTCQHQKSRPKMLKRGAGGAGGGNKGAPKVTRGGR